MAVVVRYSRNRSPFWYTCYTTADGRRLKKSTKETNQAKAKLIAEALQNAENMAAERTLTAIRTRELLQRSPSNASTAKSCLCHRTSSGLTNSRNRNTNQEAEKTALRYEQMMNEFVEFLGQPRRSQRRCNHRRKAFWTSGNSAQS